MKNLNEVKSEMREELRTRDLSTIPRIIDGVNDVRRSGVIVDGMFTCNSDEGIEIIGKDGLTLKLKTDEYNGDYHLIFENTEECENGMELEDWNGEWTHTIDETTSIYILCFLLGIE